MASAAESTAQICGCGNFALTDAEAALRTLKQMSMPPWWPMRSRELSKVLGVSLQTLANWRSRGTGPSPAPYMRGQGNRTMYRPDMVMAWLHGLLGKQVEPWELVIQWFFDQDILDIKTHTREHVEGVIEFYDRHRFFGKRKDSSNFIRD